MGGSERTPPESATPPERVRLRKEDRPRRRYGKRMLYGKMHRQSFVTLNSNSLCGPVTLPEALAALFLETFEPKIVGMRIRNSWAHEP